MDAPGGGCCVPARAHKVADLQCIADAKLKTRAFGDLGFQADLVQGGGVKIKGDSPLFKTNDTWTISRRAIDSSNYRLVATSVGTQESYELATMGGNGGRIQFGKSLSLSGQRIAVGCSVDAAQGIPRLTSVLAGIPGMAIEDWAKSVVRGR